MPSSARYEDPSALRHSARPIWRAECSACGCQFSIGEQWVEQANVEPGPYGHGLWCPMGCQRDSDNNLSTVLIRQGRALK